MSAPTPSGSRESDGLPSLDAVRFDSAGYALQGEPQPDKLRVWHTPEGDGLGLYFFPALPDPPVNAASVDELAARHLQQLGRQGSELVEMTGTTR